MHNFESYNALELAYQRFQEENKECQSPTEIEYLGLNFYEDSSISPVFKLYYTTTKSIENVSPLLNPLFSRSMIHALNKINDNSNAGCDRYEVGLKNRTNQNIEFVFHYLHWMMPELAEHRTELEALSRIKCTDLKNYIYAALYFVGMIVNVTNQPFPDTKAIKLHYLLRKCADPDKIGKNYIVNNQYYLKLLSTLKIPEFQKLSSFMDELLKASHAELWMAAVDYYKYGISKYKIYLKNFSPQIYTAIIKQFYDLGYSHLANQVGVYVQWINHHPEKERYGIAVCLDSDDHWSINFYH